MLQFGWEMRGRKKPAFSRGGKSSVNYQKDLLKGK